MKMQLTEQNFARAAAVLAVEIAAIKAVAQVEAPRGGFNPDDSPTTLFEGHVFYRLTKGKWAASNPTLCYPHQTNQFYGKTWQEEQIRLKAARELDWTAATMAASWGKFQIMGFNYAACGFTSLTMFLASMMNSEGDQLDAFIGFMQSNHLAPFLQKKNWAGFAAHYNGSGYAINRYDVKLAAAYAGFNRPGQTP